MSATKTLLWLTVTFAIFGTLSAADEGNKTTTSTEQPSAGGGAYGTACKDDKDCDAKLGLTCNGTKLCDCARPKEMMFDKEKNACTVLESFSCAPLAGMTKDLECVKHAKCSAEKKCNCTEGYSATADNKCYGDFGTSCEVDKEPCNDLKVLTCQVADGTKQGKCACPAPEDNIYDQVEGCTALAGAPCVHKNPDYVLSCVANATCEDVKDTKDLKTTRICQCDAGLKALSDRQCGTGNGQAIFPSLLAILCTIIISVLLR